MIMGEGTKRKANAQTNRESCEMYCRSMPDCVGCSRYLNCGVGYYRIKRFKHDPYSRHYSACGELERSRSNHAACEAWCRANSACVKCSTKRGCGRGYKRLRSWTGRGTNWHACGRR